MTYKEWEAKLTELLSGLSKKEIEEATAYYREIYGDKKDAGLSDEEILAGFGTPESCAGKIELSDSEEDALEEKEEPMAEKKDEKRDTAGYKIPMPTTIVGLIFLHLLILVPIYAVIIGGIAGFGGICIGGAGLAIGGLGAVILSVIQLVTGNGFSSFLAMFGMGTAMIGAGIVLAISFFFVTKYTVFATYKLVKTIYVKKSEEKK